GYGDDFTWGTPAMTNGANTSLGSIQYMAMTDNPKRPRTRMWFGPMTMVDFLGNYNQSRFYWSGAVHESPLYACKIGLQSALSDMNNNHPNDKTSLIFFCEPKSSSSDQTGRFNGAMVPLSKTYPYMIASLWFPQSTIDADGTDNGTEITPYAA